MDFRKRDWKTGVWCCIPRTKKSANKIAPAEKLHFQLPYDDKAVPRISNRKMNQLKVHARVFSTVLEVSRDPTISSQMFQENHDSEVVNHINTKGFKPDDVYVPSSHQELYDKTSQTDTNTSKDNIAEGDPTHLAATDDKPSFIEASDKDNVNSIMTSVSSAQNLRKLNHESIKLHSSFVSFATSKSTQDDGRTDGDGTSVSLAAKHRNISLKGSSASSLVKTNGALISRSIPDIPSPLSTGKSQSFGRRLDSSTPSSPVSPISIDKQLETKMEGSGDASNRMSRTVSSGNGLTEGRRRSTQAPASSHQRNPSITQPRPLPPATLGKKRATTFSFEDKLNHRSSTATGKQAPHLQALRNKTLNRSASSELGGHGHRNSTSNFRGDKPLGSQLGSGQYMSTTKLVADNRRLMYELEVVKYEKLLKTLPRVISVVDMEYSSDVDM
jgi:hypothetical protein